MHEAKACQPHIAGSSLILCPPHNGNAGLVFLTGSKALAQTDACCVRILSNGFTSLPRRAVHAWSQRPLCPREWDQEEKDIAQFWCSLHGFWSSSKLRFECLYSRLCWLILATGYPANGISNFLRTASYHFLNIGFHCSRWFTFNIGLTVGEIHLHSMSEFPTRNQALM